MTIPLFGILMHYFCANYSYSWYDGDDDEDEPDPEEPNLEESDPEPDPEEPEPEPETEPEKKHQNKKILYPIEFHPNAKKSTRSRNQHRTRNGTEHIYKNILCNLLIFKNKKTKT